MFCSSYKFIFRHVNYEQKVVISFKNLSDKKYKLLKNFMFKYSTVHVTIFSTLFYTLTKIYYFT